MKALTLQSRITLCSAAATAAGLILCAISVLLLTHYNEVREMDDQMRGEAAAFYEQWREHGGANFELEPDKQLKEVVDGKVRQVWASHEVQEWLSAIESNRYVEVADASGEIIFRSKLLQSDLLHTLPEGFGTITIDGRPWRYAVFVRDGTTIRLTADQAALTALSRSIAMAFLVTLPLLILLLMLTMRSAARVALEPLRGITASAEHITAEKPHEGVPVPEPRDEIRRLALVLNESFDRLRQSFHQAQRFSADASHELKTPLTVQRAAIESILESPELSPSQADAMAAVLEQTKRLSTITESLLLLSRADAGRLQLDLAPDNVSEILNACVEDARILAEPRRITIDATIPPDLVASIDSVRLSQIVLNLLDNAVKYNCEGGRIRLDAELITGAIAVTVGNTGPGIPPEHIPQLFDRFFRPATSQDHPGHGLGLSLAHELTRAHGGELRLTRSDHHWTEFRLTVPMDT